MGCEWFKKNVGCTIVTRFCIGAYDERWLSYRISLFENITLPSITRQKLLPDRWALIVDPNMPRAPRSRLELLISPYSFIKIVEGSYESDYGRFLVEAPLELACEQNKPFVASCRLDDDDAIQREAIEQMAQALDREQGRLVSGSVPGAVVYVADGFKYSPEYKRLLRFRPPYSIAILLSRVQPVTTYERYTFDTSKGHTDYASVAKNSGYSVIGLEYDKPGFLYTRHKCSDSTRKHELVKFVSDPRSIASDCNILSEFGMTRENSDALEAAERSAPSGLFFDDVSTKRKYLITVADLEKKIKTADGDELENLLAERKRSGSQLTKNRRSD